MKAWEYVLLDIFEKEGINPRSFDIVELADAFEKHVKNMKKPSEKLLKVSKILKCMKREVLKNKRFN